VYIDSLGRQSIVTTGPEDSEPGLSVDKASIVFVRRKTEVWRVNTDGSNGRKLFACSNGNDVAACHSPHFSADGQSVYFVRDVSEDSGGIWKLDLATDASSELISDSAKFAVLRAGSDAGAIVADQKTTEADSNGEEYPVYSFFLFTSNGEKISRVGDDSEYLPDLVEMLSR
jgi:Tol biopolymer transport system component